LLLFIIYLFKLVVLPSIIKRPAYENIWFTSVLRKSDL
jgi:hypothetical protein